MSTTEQQRARLPGGVAAVLREAPIPPPPMMTTGYPLDTTVATTLQPLLLPEVPPPPSSSSSPLFPEVAPPANSKAELAGSGAALPQTLPPPRAASSASSKVEQQQQQWRQQQRHPHHPSPYSDDDVCLIGSDETQSCMLCPKRFDMDAERDLFLAHLVMDHNVVIADVKHVPYFPGYVEEWRKMFETLPLDVCPKIKTNYVAEEEAAEEAAEAEEGASRPGGGGGRGEEEGAPDDDDGEKDPSSTPLDDDDDAESPGGAAVVDVGDGDKGVEDVAGPVSASTSSSEKEKRKMKLKKKKSEENVVGIGKGGGGGGGAGDEEEEEEEEEEDEGEDDDDEELAIAAAAAASPSSKRRPEAGDAPAVDVVVVRKRTAAASVRPALEVEDPAITAAARPAVRTMTTTTTTTPSYGRTERTASSSSHHHAAASSASLESMLSSSSSSCLSTSAAASAAAAAAAAAAMLTASQGEDYHFLLCDAIPQDRDLRHKLQRKRLEYALQRQEAERNDVTFSRLCLFCNAYFEGNRAGLFHHMAEDHNFNVGQPDNIVFSNEFLDTLQGKLDNSICLYCEKDFKDKATLKDHMRKKMHRRIRGSNREYDKFYLINYLELGKSWNDIQGEEDIEIRPGPAAESEWADWTGEGSFSVCLFCPFPSRGAEEIYAHMRNKHGFDLSRIRATLKLSFYQQIKLINFYRRKLHEHICPSCSLSFGDKESTVRHMQETNHTNDVPALVQWDQAQFFFPTYENDHLLSLLEDVDDNPEVAVVQPEDPPDSAIYNSILARKELRHEIIYDGGPVGYKGRAWK